MKRSTHNTPLCRYTVKVTVWTRGRTKSDRWTRRRTLTPEEVRSEEHAFIALLRRLYLRSMGADVCGWSAETKAAAIAKARATRAARYGPGLGYQRGSEHWSARRMRGQR